MLPSRSLPPSSITPPTPAAQATLLEGLRRSLTPLLIAEGLATTFEVRPGTRLSRAYGRCSWKAGSAQPEIAIRCTADGDRTRWRRQGAIVGTLLHELAHLKYRSHGPRFWALHRRLVDRAVQCGLYDPADRDPTERGRGDEKLATSAARSIAAQARQARRTRARANRIALQAWQPGALARIRAGTGVLAGALVTVVALRRTRLLVESASGRRYFVSPNLLVNPSSTPSAPTSASALTTAPSQK
jgi:WLM domain